MIVVACNSVALPCSLLLYALKQKTPELYFNAAVFLRYPLMGPEKSTDAPSPTARVGGGLKVSCDGEFQVGFVDFVLM